MNKQVQRVFSYILVIVVLIGVDQYAKYLTVKYLKGQDSVHLIKDVFQLTYVENRGAAFGMLQNQRVFFLIFTMIIMIIAFLILLKVPNTKRHFPMKPLIIIFIGGSIGNWIDRLRLTYVIDTFYFSLINFPVFNVADSFVVVSTIAFALFVLFYYKDEDFDFLRWKAKNENV